MRMMALLCLLLFLVACTSDTNAPTMPTAPVFAPTTDTAASFDQLGRATLALTQRQLNSFADPAGMLDLTSTDIAVGDALDIASSDDFLLFKKMLYLDTSDERKVWKDLPIQFSGDQFCFAFGKTKTNVCWDTVLRNAAARITITDDFFHPGLNHVLAYGCKIKGSKARTNAPLLDCNNKRWILLKFNIKSVIRTSLDLAQATVTSEDPVSLDIPAEFKSGGLEVISIVSTANDVSASDVRLEFTSLDKDNLPDVDDHGRALAAHDDRIVLKAFELTPASDALAGVTTRITVTLISEELGGLDPADIILVRHHDVDGDGVSEWQELATEYGGVVDEKHAFTATVPNGFSLFIMSKRRDVASEPTGSASLLDLIGLVGHWSFDDLHIEDNTPVTRDDLNRFAAIGTLGVLSGAGRLGQALKLGGGNYAGIPFHPLLIPEKMTMSMWVKTDSTLPGYLVYMRDAVSGYKRGSWEGLSLLLARTYSGETVVQFETNPLKSGARTCFRVDGLQDGAWHLISLTFDSVTGQVALYVSGDRGSSQAYRLDGDCRNVDTRPLPPPGLIESGETPPLHIGGTGTDFLSFNGLVDEFRLYNRVLTSEEIGFLGKGAYYLVPSRSLNVDEDVPMILSDPIKEKGIVGAAIKSPTTILAVDGLVFLRFFDALPSLFSSPSGLYSSISISIPPLPSVQQTALKIVGVYSNGALEANNPSLTLDLSLSDADLRGTPADELVAYTLKIKNVDVSPAPTEWEMVPLVYTGKSDDGNHRYHIDFSLLRHPLFILASAEPSDVTNGLITHFAFDENDGFVATDSIRSLPAHFYKVDTRLTDSSGFTSHWITCTSAQDGCPQWVPGKFGSALRFSSIDDLTTTKSQNALVMSNPVSGQELHDLSVSVWVRNERDISRAIMQVLGPSLEGTYQSDDLHLGLYFNRVDMDSQFGNSISWALKHDLGADYRVSHLSGGPLPSSEWQHVAFTLQRESAESGYYRHTTYINGQIVQTGSLRQYSRPVGYGWFSENNLIMGAAANSLHFNDFFYGSLDDVRIYNRALTVQEVRTLCGSTCASS